jgi:hypothetical protein
MVGGVAYSTPGPTGVVDVEAAIKAGDVVAEDDGAAPVGGDEVVAAIGEVGDANIAVCHGRSVVTTSGCDTKVY